MSGSSVPEVRLEGSVFGSLVEAISNVESAFGDRPRVVGGVAVSCRLSVPHRATLDLDVVRMRSTRDEPALEVLIRATGGTRVEDIGVIVQTGEGDARVDVIEIVEADDVGGIENENDRLYLMSHQWAYETATEVSIVIDGEDGDPERRVLALVAEPGPLVAMKLQALVTRSRAKEGTDLLDIVRLLTDPATYDSVVVQLAGCDPLIAHDVGVHALDPFQNNLARTLKLVHDAAGWDVEMDTLKLVGELILGAVSWSHQ